MLEEQWCLEVEKELAQLRREVCDLAERSSIERLQHQEKEKNRCLSRVRFILPDERLRNRPLADICSESVDRGDLDTAFLTILRYIESISRAKADSSALLGKVTRDVVERAFERLASLNAKAVAQKYDELQGSVETRLRSISEELDSFMSSIDDRIGTVEASLNDLQGMITHFAGVVPVSKTSRQTSTARSRLMTTRTVDVLNPHSGLKLRTDGIVYPNKPVPRPEPTAKALMSAVTATSEMRRTPRSLIADL